MSDDNEAREPLPRRMMTRRNRAAGGFAGGSSTRSESLRLSNEATEDEQEADEVDNVIDPNAMQRNILRQTRADNGVPSPGQRLQEVMAAGGENYSKEYRQSMLHRLLIRRVPLDQIARQMGVSVSTLQKDRVELKAALRERARQMNINELIGNQLETYDEISGMAMRIAGAQGSGEGSHPAPIRLAAMRTVLASEADRTRFLNSAGVFDAMVFRRGDDGDDVSDVQRLMDSTNDLLERILADDAMAGIDAEEETAPPPKRLTRRRKGGFGELTMDDKDASSGDAEHVEL